MVSGGRKKKHLCKYFNCLLRFGAHHKRSICAAQSWLKEETQMVPGTKVWNLIHKLDKIKPIYLTIYLLCLCEPTELLMCRCPSFHTRVDCMCAFVPANWSRALKSPERTEFFGKPIKCAVNTSVCLSLQGSDISMSPCLYFYESLDLWWYSDTHANTLEKGSRAVFVGHCATFTTKTKEEKNHLQKQKAWELQPNMF